MSPEDGGGRPAALGGQVSGSAVDLTSRSASALELSGRAGSGLDLANRLQLLNKDSHSLGEEPSPLDPGRRSPVGGARYGHVSRVKTFSTRLHLYERFIEFTEVETLKLKKQLVVWRKHTKTFSVLS